jgi:hypothetical protein
MEQITGEQDHIDISFSGKSHDLVKSLPTVLATNGISLAVADMIIGGDEDLELVCSLEKISI